MINGLNPLRHLNTFGERNLDTPTLRHVKAIALEDIGRNVALLYVSRHHAPSFEALLELVDSEDAASLEAVKRINVELERRGVPVASAAA